MDYLILQYLCTRTKKFYLAVFVLWITISTLLTYIGSDCDVVVYDSLHAHVSQVTKVLLAKLIKTPWKKLKI